MPKHAVVHKMRQVLQAAEVELTYVQRQPFGGHAARVAGALWRGTLALAPAPAAALGNAVGPAGGPRPLALRAISVPNTGVPRQRGSDKRHFAPCHYVREAFMEADGGRLVVPPPNVKEQLHDIGRGSPTSTVDARTMHWLVWQPAGTGESPGWRKRTDGRYNDPEHIQEVCRRNGQYLQSRLQGPTPSQYAEQLLEELVDEQRLGRVVGPLRAPSDWPCRTVALPHISGCDWRRSGHNAAMEADDVPTHHTVGDFVDLARRLAEEGADLVAFGHDLLNAYRRWPVRRPEHCATFLPTAAGVTLWMHMAMCFGAAASVWNFNRAGDAVA